MNIRFSGPALVDHVDVTGTLGGPTTVTVTLLDGMSHTVTAATPAEAFAGAFINCLRLPDAHES